MIVQLVYAGLLISLSAAADLKYPDKDPCILINFKSNNSLSWTPDKGKEQAIPNFNFTDADVKGGNCTDDNKYLEVIWKIDNGTMTFTFHNNSGKVSVDMTLSIVPEKVFGKYNNTDNATVTITTSMELGPVDKAFLCKTEQQLTQHSTSGDNKYSLTLRISDLTIQGFDVVNGSFSETEECARDQTTTEGPTTAPPQTTTAAPTKAPKVTLNATDGNTTCAMLVGELSLLVRYQTTKGKQDNATIFVPKDVKTSGECQNDKNMDVLTADFDDGFKMVFQFGGDKSNIWWDTLNVTINYNSSYFKDVNMTTVNKTHSHSFSKGFKAQNDGSYLCTADSFVVFDSDVTLKTAEMQYTALQKNVTAFSDKDVQECQADNKTSSIVPIAVGAALAGLVVIVLIAYLIGRRRNRKGYESV